jgi:hypothetical protein
MGTVQEWFQDRYLSEEFIEHHLNEFNALRQGSHTVPRVRGPLGLLRYALHQFTQKLKVKKFEFGLIVRIQLLLRVPGLLDRRKCVGLWGATLLHDFPKERARASRSARPTTVGVLGKAHQILAAMNKCQAEHQSTVLKTSGTIADQTLRFDRSGATESLIFGKVLKGIKVKVIEQVEFSFIEMASRAKQKVGGKVTGYTLNLGDFVTRANLYITILGSYDVMIGMD